MHRPLACPEVLTTVDQLIIAVWGWALVPVSIAHAIVLLWES